MTRIMGTLHEDQCTFLFIFRSFILGMRTILGKRCRENQDTFYIQWGFFIENLAVFEVRWKVILETAGHI